MKEIYEAVAPTRREDKALTKQRGEDLLPYIDMDHRYNNDLQTVKDRVDTAKEDAFNKMENYENTQ